MTPTMPNNAVLVVAGDADFASKDFGGKYFAGYGRREIKRPEFVVDRQEAEISEVSIIYKCRLQ